MVINAVGSDSAGHGSEGVEFVGACPSELGPFDLNAIAMINSAVCVSHAHTGVQGDLAHTSFCDFNVLEDVGIGAGMNLTGSLVLSLWECSNWSSNEDNYQSGKRFHDGGLLLDEPTIDQINGSPDDLPHQQL